MPILSTIIAAGSALGSAFGFVRKSKKIIDTITGEDNSIETEEDVQKAYNNLTPAGQEIFNTKLTKDIEMYQAQTVRLENEQGIVTTELQAKLSPEDAGKIAKLRMTTRPRIVRQLTHFILSPVYLLYLDSFQQSIFAWFNFPRERMFMAFDYCFGKIVDGGSRTIFGEMYMEVFTSITLIISLYFGLREVGKSKRGEETAIQTVISSGRGLVGKIKGIFK